jgi:hypothetical protein
MKRLEQPRVSYSDFWSSDAVAAVQALARRLASLPEATVVRLTLGTEELG